MKRVLICGGRDYDDVGNVFTILDDYVREDEGDTIAHGGCSGADSLAQEWADDRGCPCTVFPANWAEGKSAGPRRNQRMLDVFKPRILIAFPGGRGTADMIRRAEKAGVEVVRIG